MCRRAFFQADCGKAKTQRLEEERVFCGCTQPLLYQWKAFTGQILQAHHEREPHVGYEPITAFPLTTIYNH